MRTTAITLKYKEPDTNSGRLRTPVIFYKCTTNTGLELEENKEILHECMCEAYNPSVKDMAVMGTTGTKEAVTIRIRDTAGEYIPTNKHFAKLNDYRYVDKMFSVIDVRPDMSENRFITILLGTIS